MSSFHRYDFFFLICFLLCISHKSKVEANFDHDKLKEALGYINAIQQPSNCTGLEYSVVDIGLNGGFAAQFQSAAGDWMRVFASHKFTKPVLIKGKLNGYSEGKECAEHDYQWTCYFQPMSTCQAEMEATGRVVDYGPITYHDEDNVPSVYSSMGLAFWWGVVQHRMFQMQRSVEEHIHDQARLMNYGMGFPFGVPMAGLHVRHGDKHTDGFKEHSLSESLRSIRKSPDCFIRSESSGQCFSLLNTSYDHHHTRLLPKLVRRDIILVDSKNIDMYNSTGVQEIRKNASLPKNEVYDTYSELIEPKRLQLAIKNNAHNRYKNSFYRHHDNRKQHTTDEVVPTINNVSVEFELPWSILPIEHTTYVFPLQVFVASDDLTVLTIAGDRGFLADFDGVSQQTGNTGMLSTLLEHHEIAYNASLEVIRDIFFLSQCSSLLGVAGSQVFRMAVAMSNSSGILQHAAAEDYDQIERVRGLSNKYKVVFAENFLEP